MLFATQQLSSRRRTKHSETDIALAALASRSKHRSTRPANPDAHTSTQPTHTSPKPISTSQHNAGRPGSAKGEGSVSSPNCEYPEWMAHAHDPFGVSPPIIEGKIGSNRLVTPSPSPLPAPHLPSLSHPLPLSSPSFSDPVTPSRTTPTRPRLLARVSSKASKVSRTISPRTGSDASFNPYLDVDNKEAPKVNVKSANENTIALDSEQLARAHTLPPRGSSLGGGAWGLPLPLPSLNVRKKAGSAVASALALGRKSRNNAIDNGKKFVSDSPGRGAGSASSAIVGNTSSPAPTSYPYSGSARSPESANRSPPKPIPRTTSRLKAKPQKKETIRAHKSQSRGQRQRRGHSHSVSGSSGARTASASPDSVSGPGSPPSVRPQREGGLEIDKERMSETGIVNEPASALQALALKAIDAPSVTAVPGLNLPADSGSKSRPSAFTDRDSVPVDVLNLGQRAYHLSLLSLSDANHDERETESRSEYGGGEGRVKGRGSGLLESTSLVHFPWRPPSTSSPSSSPSTSDSDPPQTPLRVQTRRDVRRASLSLSQARERTFWVEGSGLEAGTGDRHALRPETQQFLGLPLGIGEEEGLGLTCSGSEYSFSHSQSQSYPQQSYLSQVREGHGEDGTLHRHAHAYRGFDAEISRDGEVEIQIEHEDDYSVFEKEDEGEESPRELGEDTVVLWPDADYDFDYDYGLGFDLDFDFGFQVDFDFNEDPVSNAGRERENAVGFDAAYEARRKRLDLPADSSSSLVRGTDADARVHLAPELNLGFEENDQVQVHNEDTPARRSFSFSNECDSAQGDVDEDIRARFARDPSLLELGLELESPSLLALSALVNPYSPRRYDFSRDFGVLDSTSDLDLNSTAPGKRGGEGKDERQNYRTTDYGLGEGESEIARRFLYVSRHGSARDRAGLGLASWSAISRGFVERGLRQVHSSSGSSVRSSNSSLLAKALRRRLVVEQGGREGSDEEEDDDDDAMSESPEDFVDAREGSEDGDDVDDDATSLHSDVPDSYEVAHAHDNESKVKAKPITKTTGSNDELAHEECVDDDDGPHIRLSSSSESKGARVAAAHVQVSSTEALRSEHASPVLEVSSPAASAVALCVQAHPDAPSEDQIVVGTKARNTDAVPSGKSSHGIPPPPPPTRNPTVNAPPQVSSSLPTPSTMPLLFPTALTTKAGAKGDAKEVERKRASASASFGPVEVARCADSVKGRREENRASGVSTGTTRTYATSATSGTTGSKRTRRSRGANGRGSGSGILGVEIPTPSLALDLAASSTSPSPTTPTEDSTSDATMSEEEESDADLEGAENADEASRSSASTSTAATPARARSPSSTAGSSLTCGDGEKPGRNAMEEQVGERESAPTTSTSSTVYSHSSSPRYNQSTANSTASPDTASNPTPKRSSPHPDSSSSSPYKHTYQPRETVSPPSRLNPARDSASKQKDPKQKEKGKGVLGRLKRLAKAAGGQ